MYSGPDLWAFCLDMLFITKELQNDPIANLKND